MRITFLSPRSNLSGGLRVVAIYAQMLKDRGHEVTIVTPAAPKRSRMENIKAKLSGVSLAAPDGAGHFEHLDVRIVESARDDYLFTQDDIPDGDILIATWWETAFAAAAMPRSKGIGIYLIQHHEIHDWLPWQMSRATYYLPLHQIVVSNWLAQEMKAHYNRDNTYLVPNGIDLEHFNAPPRDKAARPTIGFLYSSDPLKGTALIVEAAKLIQKQIPDLRVVSFGVWPVQADIPLPPGSQYHQRPDQSQLAEIYAACDLFICGSSAEGYFLPLLEAMACRTPLVSTRVGAAADLVEAGKTGHIVESRSARALADAAIDILSLPNEDWRGMSDACRARAQTHSWDKACDRLERVLLDVHAGQS